MQSASSAALSLGLESARWVAPGQQIHIGGVSVGGGQFYLGRSLPAQRGSANEAFLVDPVLLVADDSPDFEGRSIDFWPDYGRMRPQARLAFLRWIAEGRIRSDIHPGYVLLYLYGLERRLLLEQVFEDAPAILGELELLAGRYARHNGLRKAMRGIVDAAAHVLTGNMNAVAPMLNAAPDRPLASVLYAIGHALSEEQPIDPDLLLMWVANDASRSFPLPADDRTFELRKGLREHVKAVRPKGVFFDTNGLPPLTYAYRSYGGSFAIDVASLARPVPDISQSTAARMEAHVLVRDAVHRLSRDTGRRGGAKRHSVPTDIKSTEVPVGSPPFGKNALQAWALEQLDGDGCISLRAALKRLRGQPPKVLARSEVQRLADVLAQVGLGIVPDPRFDLEPSRVTEDALLFRLANKTDNLEAASEHYHMALLTTMIAASVAGADGDVSAKETEFILQLIQRIKDITEDEQRRLQAERQWMLLRPLPLSPVLEAINRLTDRQRMEIASNIIGVAHSDGLIPSSERAFATAVLRYLRLSGVDVGHRLMPSVPAVDVAAISDDRYDDDARSNGTGQPSEHYSPEAEDIDVQSDNSALSAETDISSDPNWKHLLERPDVDTKAMPLECLDEKHREFALAMFQQANWKRQAVEQVARDQRLMPDGAIETINEWAFEHAGDLLLEIDDGGSVTVNFNLISELQGST